MAEKRRSLNDALTPEQGKFLKEGAGNKKSQSLIDDNDTPAPSVATANLASEVGIEQKSIPPQTPEFSSPAKGHLALGTVNSRIDARITTALLRASLDRRIEGVSPWLHRDIIAEALTDWLTKHDYKI